MTATKLPKLDVTNAFWMRAGHLICAPVLAALLGASPAMAQSAAAPKAKPPAPTLTKDEVTALAGVTVKKTDPAPVSGVTVTARRSAAVSELTVTLPLCPPAKDVPDPDTEPPKLLSSYPASGATVRGCVVILRLTFDRPMTCDGLLNRIAHYENPCPAPLNAAMFSRDRRTFLTVCILHPRREASRRLAFRTPAAGEVDPQEVDASFSLRLENFTSLAGQPLKPYALIFYIDQDAQPVQTMQDAMAQDKFLRDAQKAAERSP